LRRHLGSIERREQLRQKKTCLLVALLLSRLELKAEVLHQSTQQQRVHAPKEMHEDPLFHKKGVSLQLAENPMKERRMSPTIHLLK